MGIFRLTFLKFFIVVVATSLVVSGLYVFTTFAVLITPKFRVPRMRFCFAIIFLSHLCAVVRPSSASHHQDRNQTRVAILTWATPPAITKYQDMLNTKTCYTLKHGYSFLLESNMLETEKNIFWNKQRVRIVHHRQLSSHLVFLLSRAGSVEIFAVFRLDHVDRRRYSCDERTCASGGLCAARTAAAAAATPAAASFSAGCRSDSG